MTDRMATERVAKETNFKGMTLVSGTKLSLDKSGFTKIVSGTLQLKVGELKIAFRCKEDDLNTL